MKKNNLRWAFKTLILSIFLSIVFSVVSQSLFPNLSIFLSLFIIAFFIVISVIFDMISVAVTSIKLEQIEKYSKQKGYQTAIKLCQNTEKISSFCGDVVGDICGILSGAGGVSLVLNMHLQDESVYFIVTCVVSALIAGLTIFGKAVMKGYSVDKCENVVMKTASIMETSPLALIKGIKFKRKKVGNKNKSNDFDDKSKKSENAEKILKK